MTRDASFDVICCGVAAYDYIWRVDELPAGDGKFTGRDHLQRIGGLAANAAIAVARLGGRPALWARGGADDAGRKMMAEVSAYGVDVEHFRLLEGMRSVQAAVIVDRVGSRMIVSYRDRPFPDATDWLPLEHVPSAGAVHADTRWPAGTIALFNAARAADIPSVLDVETTDRAHVDRMLPATDHAIFSLAGFRDYTRTADIRAGLELIAAAGARVAAVTLNADGVAWFDAGVFHRIQGFVVDAVDTTGAGDVFHGAYAYALACKMSISEAMRFASATAALKCTQFGGGAGTPTREEVETFLASHSFND